MESDPIGLRGGINTYIYVGDGPVSKVDPQGLKCVANIGCWSTPAELALANAGNYSEYYQLACANGDDYACFAQHIAANDTVVAHLAQNHLVANLATEVSRGHLCIDEKGVLEQIRKDLAKAYANYLPSDERDARQPTATDIAEFHWTEFARYGLPRSTFAGTPYGGRPLLYHHIVRWCPNCR